VFGALRLRQALLALVGKMLRGAQGKGRDTAGTFKQRNGAAQVLNVTQVELGLIARPYDKWAS